MTRFGFAFLVLSSLSAGVLAQSAARVVRATGEGVVSVKPDQAKINVGVTTQADTAQEAAARNATQVEAVLTQLRQVLGANADIKTISYSLTPNYRYSQTAPPVLVGFTASNVEEVTMSDLSLIGRVIDAASQAGANNVQGLRFTVKDQEPFRAQVLGLAAKQARARAEAIATGLGGRIDAVLIAQEGALFDIRNVETRTASATPQTPIETGLVEIRATVTVEVELL